MKHIVYVKYNTYVPNQIIGQINPAGPTGSASVHYNYTLVVITHCNGPNS